VTVEAASSELWRLAAAVDVERPRRVSGASGSGSRLWLAKSVLLIAEEGNIVRRFGYVIIGLVALVLVVACTNLSNLLLARGAVRRQDFAVRRALGASRWRLVREQLAESGLVALAGAAGAIVVILALRLLWNGDIPIGQNRAVPITPGLSPTAVAAATCALLLSLIVFGLEPALQLSRVQDVRSQLADGSGGMGAPRTRRHGLLLRWQVAISTGFFVIAILCVRHTVAEALHDPGIDLDRLAVGTIDLATLQMDDFSDLATLTWDATRVRRTVDRIIEETAKEHALVAASVSTGLPFGTPAGSLLAVLHRTDAGSAKAREGEKMPAVAATPSIFLTLGVPITKGRGFDKRDDEAAKPVIVLSEHAARTMFGTTDAVGRQLTLTVVVRGRRASSGTATVIGIARDTDVGQLFLRNDLVYVPLAQQLSSLVTLTGRARGDADQAVAAVRAVVRRVDSDLPVQRAGTARVVLTGPSVFLRTIGILALSLGGVTLLLAMVGLYGIQSLIVAHRTREMGIRVSLGATPANIKKMVLKEGYRPVIEGLLIGLFIGLAGRTIVRSYLVTNLSVVDPWMLFLAPIPVLFATFFACYLPAHRAALVDPNVALRTL